MIRRFELHRHDDVTGVSGTGVVAEGVILSSGKGVIEWLTEWPTSVVWHDRGIESVEHVHGHNGRTRIVWVDPDRSPRSGVEDEDALYLRLMGARENLCLAQMLGGAEHRRDALGRAVNEIDSVGAVLPQWSRHNQPPLPGESAR